ncbi:MAG: DUF3857 domain-containing protein [Bacteroidetes bacterium]|nr:DUF3857 domain-containing protein [Bacteroidota bacterium]
MKKLIGLIAGLITITAAHAQSGLDAASIPEAMKKNAHSVVREQQIEFVVKNAGKAITRIHQVITVLDEAGKDELRFRAYSDQFQSLESFSMQLFDANGKSIKRYSSSDLGKQANMSDLVPSGKIYYLDPPAPDYPITVQQDFEIKYDGMLQYDDFDIQQANQSVQHAVFTARMPEDLDLRYKARHCALKPDTANDGKNKVYTWTVNSLAAFEDEEGSVNRRSRYPRIELAPSKFSIDDYDGDMSSWKSFGTWYNQLLVNVMNLPEDRKVFFRNMVKDITDDKEKIRALYSYLQNNFRYVSIQLGIGGYKPFDANFVDKKKYGDCKALSNYMRACLDAVGIKSNLALINSNYNSAPVDPDFSKNGFNHMILCVPMQKDSVWLECTSTINDFGVLGNFTENRNALLITQDGGVLVPTPKSKASENLFNCHTIVKLQDDGSGDASVELRTTGEYRQDMLWYMFDQKKDDQKKLLVDYYGFLQPDDFSVNYEKENKLAPVKIQLLIEKVPEFSAGNKKFLSPRIYKLWRSALPKAENRTQDYYFETPFIKTDTTVYVLPEGYGLETLPKTKDLKFEYGSFKSTYQYDETQKTITSVARLELDQYKIPAAKFADTKKFFNDVLGEYTEKIVIRKL